jgi:RimJ/RimL family protein N-acetyltransferase
MNGVPCRYASQSSPAPLPDIRRKKFAMLYYIYKRPMTDLSGAGSLPSDLRVEVWRPTIRHPVHRCLTAFPFLAWSLFHFARVFASRDYAIVLLFQGKLLVHRTCLVPAHFRFPFMAAPDLQAAGIWTDPALRGRGLALLAMAEGLGRMGNPDRTLWYLTRVENAPSIRVAEKAGFRRFGRVVRRNWLGVRLLGRFHLEETFSDTQPGPALIQGGFEPDGSNEPSGT